MLNRVFLENESKEISDRMHNIQMVHLWSLAELVAMFYVYFQPDLR